MKQTATLSRIHARSQVVLYSVLVLLFPLAVGIMDALDPFRRMILVLLGFSAIIFVHELGHFLVARLCSVKCEVFSIGIGWRLCGWKKGVGFSFGPAPEDRKPKNLKNPPEENTAKGMLRGGATSGDLEQTATDKGETDYRLSWLPLGGYVRMLGQDDMDPTKQSADPRAFNRRPIWQRMCIVSAGVIMNIITAAMIFSIIFQPSVGVPFPPGAIGDVVYNSPAHRAGFRPGDQILWIHSKDEAPLGFLEWTDVIIASALSRGTEPITFHVRRPDGSELDLNAKPESMPGAKYLAIGVQQMPSLHVISGVTPKEFEELTKDEPDSRQFKPDDRIVKVNGRAVEDPKPDSPTVAGGYYVLQEEVRKSAGKPVKLTVLNPQRPGSTAELELTPKLMRKSTIGDAPGILGFQPRVRLDGITKDTPAEKAGLKKGDVVVRLGDELASPNARMFREDIEAHPDLPLKVAVLRDGKVLEKLVTPKKIKNKQGRYIGRIGVPLELVELETAPVIASSDGDSRLPEIRPGTVIRTLNGQEVRTWADVVAFGRTLKAGDTLAYGLELPDQRPQNFTVKLGGDEKQLDPLLASIAGPVTAYDFRLNNPPVEVLVWVQKASPSGGVGEAMMMGMQHTKKFVLQTYLTLRGLFIRTVDVTELHGIIAIGKIGYDVQDRGLAYLWFVLAVVSVNLAVANFLPLPIVDGGLFLLLILEKVRGRPLPMKLQQAINWAGICLLGLLFLFVTVNDIRFVGGWK